MWLRSQARNFIELIPNIPVKLVVNVGTLIKIVARVKSLFAPIADILMMLALQAARNVKAKAIETYGLNVVKKKVRRDSSKPVQTTLFNVGMYEPSSDNTLPQKGKRRVGENPEYKQLSLWDI
jgi:hypothetical protein